MTITINLWKLITLIIVVLALMLAPMATAQVTLATYSYTSNQAVSVLQYANYNAPVVRIIPAGQSMTLLQPVIQDGLFYYAPLNTQNTEWVLFASASNCDRHPFGTLTLNQ